MIKKLSWVFFLGLILILPFKTSAVGEKLSPPSFMKVKVDGRTVAENDLVITKEEVITLDGGAQPGSQVFLYINSTNPLVAKVKADKNGFWTYTLNQALAKGNHQISGEVHVNNQISARVDLLIFKVTTPLGKILPSKSNAVYWILILLFLTTAGLYWQRKNIFETK